MQKPPSRSLLRTIFTWLLASAALATVCGHAAEPYPSRPITLVVPFPAGGTTDIVGRAVAQSLTRILGKSLIVDNKSGAAGTIGALQVARAAPDGYTLLMGGPGDQVNGPFMMAKAPYDAARDFEPVGCVLRAPNLLVVNPKLPVRNVAELVRLAKSQPSKLNFASAGVGNTSHLLGELFNQSAGVSIAHVPYRGNAPALTDVIGGQVEMMFANPVSVMQYIKTGALRALAVTSSKRLAELPDVPTLRESGLAIENYSWTCVMAPARTPKDILEKLHSAVMRSLDDPVVQKTLATAGGERFSPSREEARSFIAAERATWGSLIRARHIRVEE